jgi:hypothetical protein
LVLVVKLADFTDEKEESLLELTLLDKGLEVDFKVDGVEELEDNLEADRTTLDVDLVVDVDVWAALELVVDIAGVQPPVTEGTAFGPVVIGMIFDPQFAA